MYGNDRDLTAGGTSMAVAIASQMTPSRKSNVSVNQQHNNGKPQSPHLFPKEAPKFKRAAITTAKA